MALNPFPLEVWEVLLEALAPQDAYNVYLAFPDLQAEAVIRNKLAEWMFFLVAHRICPLGLLKREDLLNSRLVCRLWCQGIDNMIQHRPKYFVFPYDRETSGQLHLLNRDPFQPHPYGMLGGISNFKDVDTLQKFLSKMDGRNRNPLLFRGLILEGVRGDWGWDEEPERGEDGLASFWRSSLDFVKTYGMHIWCLTTWSHDRDLISLVRFLLPALHCMPNLKALELLGIGFNKDDEGRINGIVEGYSGRLPPMAQLVCLDLSENVIPGSLVHCLISAFGGQLKSVKLACNYWRDEYAQMFPKLTELTLANEDIREISRVLTLIDSPGLAKLSLDFTPFGSVAERSLHSSVVPILSRFPKLEYFHFYFNDDFRLAGPEWNSNNHKVSNHTTRISSVRSLYIELKAEAMNLDLLMCFPNIRNVQVDIPLSFVHFYSGSPLLWEVACPKLEYVSTCGYKYGVGYRHQTFDREYYNRRKLERECKKDVEVEVDVEGISELFQSL